MATIRKRKDKWQVQVRRFGYGPMSRSFVQRRDAETWARQTEVALDRNEIVRCNRDQARTTVGDLFKRYATEATPQKRGSAVEAIRINALQRTALAKATLKELSSSHLASHRDARLARVSASTVRREFAIIRHVLQTARREWGMQIARDVIELVRLPSPPRGRERRVSDKEAVALFAALDKSRNPYVGPASRFAVATGLRRGELLAMCWRDVDFNRRLLAVPETKTATPRTIPLTFAALDPRWR